jgi:hypothetical protein
VPKDTFDILDIFNLLGVLNILDILDTFNILDILGLLRLPSGFLLFKPFISILISLTIVERAIVFRVVCPSSVAANLGEANIGGLPTLDLGVTPGP